MGRVSLAELKAAGVAIPAEDAAAIVREICRRHAGGTLEGIPEPQGITLSRDGALSVAGPLKTDAPILGAAALVEQLASETPGALRLMLARAAGLLDLPPFASLDEFSAALDRFAPIDAGDAARNLYRSWTPARGPRSARYAWAAVAAALVILLIGLLMLPSRAPVTPRHVAASDTPSPMPPVAEARTTEPEAPPVRPQVHKVARKEPARERSAKKSFFKRELFRIVIR
jgi:hypothetical protein